MHVSIVDVARNAGVSKSTVSRVLTDDARVRPETRRRVEQSIAALGYRPNALARGLIRGRTHALGLVVFDLANPFFGELLVRGAVQAARARGYTIVICDSAGSVEQQRASMTMFAEQRVTASSSPRSIPTPRTWPFCAT